MLEQREAEGGRGHEVRHRDPALPASLSRPDRFRSRVISPASAPPSNTAMWLPERCMTTRWQDDHHSACMTAASTGGSATASQPVSARDDCATALTCVYIGVAPLLLCCMSFLLTKHTHLQRRHGSCQTHTAVTQLCMSDSAVVQTRIVPVERTYGSCCEE